MSERAKYDIRVKARTTYLADQSDEAAGRYVFAYTITISNTGTVAARLISRHWIIRDEQDEVVEVKGLGVVGHQPLLRPGESFQYSSASRLRTATGTMHGQYFCVAEDGTRFEAEIPMFVLEATPDSPARVLH